MPMSEFSTKVKLLHEFMKYGLPVEIAKKAKSIHEYGSYDSTKKQYYITDDCGCVIWKGYIPFNSKISNPTLVQTYPLSNEELLALPVNQIQANPQYLEQFASLSTAEKAPVSSEKVATVVKSDFYSKMTKVSEEALSKLLAENKKIATQFNKMEKTIADLTKQVQSLQAQLHNSSTLAKSISNPSTMDLTSYVKQVQSVP